MPTREEIDLATASIRNSWSEKERQKRAGQTQSNSWRPPLVSLTDLLSEEGFSGITADQQ